MFNVDDWCAAAEYLIFDDIDFDYVPAKKCFFGAQKSFTVTDKYRGKRTVNWGKPLIFLCNTHPFLKLEGNELDWFNDNSVVVTLQSPLF